MENSKQHNTFIVGLLSIIVSMATLGCSNSPNPLGMHGGDSDAETDFSQLSPEEQGMAKRASERIDHYRKQVKSTQEEIWKIQQEVPAQEKKDAQQLYALKLQLITNMIQLGVPSAEAEAALSPSEDDVETLKGSVQGVSGDVKMGSKAPRGSAEVPEGSVQGASGDFKMSGKALEGSAKAPAGSVQGASSVIKAVELNPAGGSIPSL